MLIYKLISTAVLFEKTLLSFFRAFMQFETNDRVKGNLRIILRTRIIK